MRKLLHSTPDGQVGPTTVGAANEPRLVATGEEVCMTMVRDEGSSRSYKLFVLSVILSILHIVVAASELRGSGPAICA